MLASTSNLDRQPFRLTPDPKFVYISPAQLVAYSRLFRAIHKQQECLLLTGDPGTGKTLFLRRLLLDLENAGITVCAFWNPVSNAHQLWEACCKRIGLNVDPSQETDLRSALLGSLKENAASMALLLDEADAIPMLVLEAITSHFAACPGEKAAVSILLCGQPALETRLQILGLAASIATSIRLEPLHRQEIAHFIRHHLDAQAGDVEYQFSPEAVERIIAHCGGLPAQINTWCSGALLLAELEGQTTVTAEIIDELTADNWMASSSSPTNDFPERIDRKATIHAQRQRPHTFDHKIVQSATVEHRPAPQGRPSRHYLELWRHRLADDPDEALRRVKDATQKAIALDQQDYRSHWARGQLALWVDQDHDLALTEYTKALALNPTHADMMAMTATLMSFMGRPDDAVRWIEKAKRIDPYHPVWYDWIAGFTYFMARDYEKAVLGAKKTIAVYPKNISARRTLIATYVEMGRVEEAKKVAREILKIDPEFKLSKVRNVPFQHESDHDRYFGALAEAGLPE